MYLLLLANTGLVVFTFVIVQNLNDLFLRRSRSSRGVETKLKVQWIILLTAMIFHIAFLMPGVATNIDKLLSIDLILLMIVGIFILQVSESINFRLPSLLSYTQYIQIYLDRSTEEISRNTSTKQKECPNMHSNTAIGNKECTQTTTAMYVKLIAYIISSKNGIQEFIVQIKQGHSQACILSSILLFILDRMLRYLVLSHTTPLIEFIPISRTRYLIFLPMFILYLSSLMPKSSKTGLEGDECVPDFRKLAVIRTKINHLFILCVSGV
ncbi:hypothetical protein CWI42_120950 [Ordospora colligata]|uniref:Uncharacterized protein n=1 Tax=Ordospora colligata OC4 TaxID=1354746 RepID=A0A0B2UHR7_9MICR|nr:uncharacterized protein M896_120950 [Ordospora colligata OC4]KHN68873.1 hypothetical protein M896_120950 [Ordospora colligata OC4]TBU13907.1 hypothetical protein CWI40_120950 [Ordospora colligata]TBU14096.1 hypothetical protein CWI41_120950 [Ordospora colligata]TBU17765.1 hypothetical protein CWI42_120950 [Ordospora colligata]